MTRINNFLALLRAQLWLVPGLLSLAALVLAYWVLTYGAALIPDGGKFWWLYSGNADTGRGLLSSFLSGLMTMTSLVVSVTFVILTLAANQLGPRLISTFMADRQIQVVLGLFLGTILYIVIVLRSLDGALGTEGVPHFALTVASALTVICLFALLFYVHKIARSIIADTIVERVGHELRTAVHDMVSDAEPAGAPPRPQLAPAVQTIALGHSGYIQTIDYDALVHCARKADAVLRVDVRAGHFILQRGEHVRVHGARTLDDHAVEAVRSAFIVGSERSPAQDLEYSIRQLVEIALRALSPGINDAYTAVAVVDRLGAALEEIVSRRLPPVLLCDRDDNLRVVADRSDAQGLVAASFNEVRQAARNHPSVLIRIADLLGQLAPALRSNDEAREAVLDQLSRIEEGTGRADLVPSDRETVLRRVQQARTQLAARPAPDRFRLV